MFSTERNVPCERTGRMKIMAASPHNMPSLTQTDHNRLASSAFHTTVLSNVFTKCYANTFQTKASPIKHWDSQLDLLQTRVHPPGKHSAPDGAHQRLISLQPTSYFPECHLPFPYCVLSCKCWANSDYGYTTCW